MKFGGLIALCLLAVGGVMADTVTSVSCATFGAPLATASSSCYAPGPSGYSQATSTGSVVLPNGPYDPLVATAQTDVSGLQGGIRGFGTVSTATASADVEVNLNTGGSLRPGLLEVMFTQTAWQVPYSGFMSEQFTIGSYSYSAQSTGLSLPTFWIPIELGSEFDLDLMQYITSDADSFSGVTSASIGSQLSVLAFESDGTTGVQLFDPPGASLTALAAPEPNTGGLIAALMALVAGVVFVRRRSS